MQGEKAERGNALGEKEGSEKGQAAKQAARPLSLFPFFPSALPICVSLRCGERATSLARALPPPHSTGLLPMCEVKCIAGTGRGPYRGAKQCVERAHSRFRSFARSSFHCGQSIAMNSCECSTTNTHSPSFVYPNGIIALRC